MKLYHRIGSGGEDSARVRAFISAHGLIEGIEFCNVAYESHASALRLAVGQIAVPTLLVEGEPPYVGAEAILNRLQKI